MAKRISVILALLLLCLLPSRAQRVDNRYAETWYQYAPAVVDLGLGFTGVKAEHGILDRPEACFDYLYTLPEKDEQMSFLEEAGD